MASQAQSASKHFMIGGSLVSRDTSAAVSSVSPSVFESLCRYQRSLGELLRHFWACFPVVNQQLEQKVKECHFVLSAAALNELHLSDGVLIF